MDDVIYRFGRYGKIYKCPHCYETGGNLGKLHEYACELDYGIDLEYFARGYLGLSLDPPFTDTCPYCGTKLIDTGISFDDAITIRDFSNFDRDLFEMMIELHQSDIVEYTVKIKKMKNSIEEEKELKRKKSTNYSSNIPKCPICGSTNLSKISIIKTGMKIGAFGLLGAGDVGKTWKCNNCGSKF